MEEIWNFGYRGTISLSEYYWHGTLYAPRWHPVRSVGLDDLLVLRFCDEWNVFIDGDYTRFEVLDAVQLVKADGDALERHDAVDAAGEDEVDELVMVSDVDGVGLE